MANSYYNAGNVPASSAALSSATIRAEFAAIAAAFDKLPTPGSGSGTFDDGTFSNCTVSAAQLYSCNLGTAAAPSSGTVFVLDVALATAGVYTALGGGSAGIGRHASYANGFTLFTSDGSAGTPTPRLTIDAKGNVLLGDLAAPLATTAVNGFFYIPTCAGTPTGVPATTGAAGSSLPMIYDKTNNKIAVYSGGAWRQTAALS